MKTKSSIFALSAALFALGAYGCAPNAEKTERAPAPAPAPAAMQSCDDLGRVDAVVGESVTTMCEIKLTGLDEGSSFKVELISGTVTDEGMPGEDSMVRVTKMVGTEPGQVIEESPVGLLVTPSYQDVNGDGEGDLLVTRDMGNVNSVYGVWLGSPDGAPFYRVGEVAGEFGPLTSDGYLTVSARSNAATHCVSFYSLTDRQLTQKASACVTALDETGKEVECVLEDTGDPNALPINAETQAKFCGEPSVANVFQ